MGDRTLHLDPDMPGLEEDMLDSAQKEDMEAVEKTYFEEEMANMSTTPMRTNARLNRWNVHFEVHPFLDARIIHMVQGFLKEKALMWWRELKTKPNTWA